MFCFSLPCGNDLLTGVSGTLQLINAGDVFLFSLPENDNKQGRIQPDWDRIAEIRNFAGC
jgi:hypothetical protein